MDKKERTPTFSVWKERLKRYFPILTWLPLYKKTDLIADMIAGVTVGLTLIPQSVAYASLAGLSPEYGLYSSFMGSFIYVIFGTVKEVSVGPTSLVSLLTLEFTRDLPVQFVFLLTLMCGCVELILGVLQFGFLVNFISVPVTTSFQSATSLIIISSQLKDALGVSKFKSGRFLKNVLTVGQKINETRMGDLALSIFCCTFLLSLRKLKDVKISKTKEPSSSDKMIKKTLWFISISRNAICVFITCATAYVFSLYNKYPFKLSGNIPSGLPSFEPPLFSVSIRNETLSFPEMIVEMGSGIIVLPLIGILANVTIAKAFSTGSPVNANQEMLTLGLCNISGSFVGSMPTCGAFTRSAVSNSSGVRTPLAGLFTGSLIILVIKFLTPYFFYIPKATLASILICAVIFMVDWRTLLLLWKVNKTDFYCAVATFTVCLALGVQTGLLFGVIINVCYLLYLWARPSVVVEIKALCQERYYWVTPDIGLYFPAADFLRNKITSKCTEKIPIVIDCIHFKGVDYTTAQGIQDLGLGCKKKGQKLIFKNMSSDIYSLLRNASVNLDLRSQNTLEEGLRDILTSPGENLVLFTDNLPSKIDTPLIKTSIIGTEEKPLM